MADYSQPNDVLKRVRFFDGQFLQDQDFIDEQRYHLDRERRLSRSIGLAGVARGLAVAAVADTPYRLIVGAGHAVDELGRHLVLAEATPLDLPTSFAKKQSVEVRLVFREVEADVAQTGGKSARRWDETPIVAAVATDVVAVAPADAPTTWDSSGVLLGRISVSDKGVVTVGTVATDPPATAGLSVPGLVRSGRLEVTGDLLVGTGTAFNAAGWGRIVDLYGDNHARLLTRTATIQSFFASHSQGAWGAPAGSLLGNESDHPLTVITRGVPRLTVLGGGAVTDARAGNVGIGTTAPTARLQVQGGGGTSVDLVVNGRIRSGNDEGGLWVGAGSDRFVGGVDGSSLGLFNGGQWALTVTRAGDTGIGTRAPKAKLEVAGTGGETVDLLVNGRLRSNNNNGGLWVAEDRLVGGVDTSSIGLMSGGTWALTVTKAGDTGIGTRAPKAKLEVAGKGGVTVDLLVNGRLRSNSNDGGLWIAEDRFVGGFETDKVGLYNTTAGFGLTMVKAGHVGIGTTAPENAESWNRVLDVRGTTSTKLSVRTSEVDARVMAHDLGFWGSVVGMVVGTKSNHGLSLGTNAATRLTITNTGNVGIGTTAPGNRLTVSSPSEHLQLRREMTATTGGKQVFLELLQDDPNGRTVPEVYPTIRFTHANRFWNRIEARLREFHFKEGDVAKDDQYIGLVAGSLDVRSGSARSGNHPAAFRGLYVTGDFGPAGNGVEFRHSNGTQGIGFGHNSIYATGSNDSQDLNLFPRGTGGIGIGTSSPKGILDVNGTTYKRGTPTLGISGIYQDFSDISSKATWAGEVGFGTKAGAFFELNAQAYGPYGWGNSRIRFYYVP